MTITPPTTPTLPVDPATLDDATLSALQQAVSAEANRRAQLASAPNSATTACWQYKMAGGDPHDVLAAVQGWLTANP